MGNYFKSEKKIGNITANHMLKLKNSELFLQSIHIGLWKKKHFTRIIYYKIPYTTASSSTIIMNMYYICSLYF